MKKTAKPTGRAEMPVTRALVSQVSRCAQGNDERDITTFISLPMWKLWNKEAGRPELEPPTEWNPGPTCNRVYGSETVVLDAAEDEFFAVSVSLCPGCGCLH